MNHSMPRSLGLRWHVDGDVAEILDRPGFSAFRRRRHGDRDFGDVGVGGDQLPPTNLPKHVVLGSGLARAIVQGGVVDAEKVAAGRETFEGDEPAFGVWKRDHDAGAKELESVDFGGALLGLLGRELLKGGFEVSGGEIR